MKSKIGIFGGSFDPFHIGHRSIVEAAISHKTYDEFLVMPTGVPAYKDRFLGPASYRFAMTRLGLSGLPGVHINTLELENTVKHSYTAETLKEIHKIARRKYGTNFNLYLIYGSDALDTFEFWYRPKEILKQAHLQIALRGNEALQADKYKRKAQKLVEKFGGKISFFPMEPIEISSTELRADLKKDKVKKKYFSEGTAKFLKENKPYIFADELQAINEETHMKLRAYEQEIWFMMSEDRRIHSVNVALFAMHLAGIHGVDKEKALIAGLLHDACKHLKLSTQIDYVHRSNFNYPVNAAIAHGPASAYWASQHLGITDQDIYNAIMYHTTGRPGMSELEKVIYLADKLEYARSFKGLEPIRQAAFENLDEGMRLCVRDVEKALKTKGGKMHSLSLGLVNELFTFDEKVKNGKIAKDKKGLDKISRS